MITLPQVLTQAIPYLPYITAAISLLGTATAFIALAFAARARRNTKLLEALLDAAQSEALITATRSRRVLAEVRRLRRRCSAMRARIATLEARRAGQSYDQAIEWVRRGANPEALTQNFGLSRGEADLVTLMHGRKKTA
jgi:Protein of unknown function (DUF2802)